MATTVGAAIICFTSCIYYYTIHYQLQGAGHKLSILGGAWWVKISLICLVDKSNDLDAETIILFHFIFENP